VGQTSNPKHSQHQQHELLMLHNGVGPRALALATLDLQVSQDPRSWMGPQSALRAPAQDYESMGSYCTVRYGCQLKDSCLES